MSHYFWWVAFEQQSYVFSTHDLEIRWKRNIKKQKLKSRMKIEHNGIKGRSVQTAVAIDWNVLGRLTGKQEVVIQSMRAVNNKALNHQLGFNSFKA